MVFITPAFPPDRGGLALALERLVRGLAAQWPVEVVVSGVGAPGLATFQRDGVTVVRLQGVDGAVVQQQTFGLLRDRAPHRLVHAVYPSATGFLAVYYARYCSRPVVLGARGNDLERDIFRPERQGGLLFALQGADAVVGVSQDLTRQATALGARRGVWIPNGVDPGRFAPQPRDGSLAARWGLADAWPVVVFAGEARAKKGLAVMLAALALLVPSWPRLRLVLLGGVRGDAAEAFATWQHRHPELAARVILVPWVEQSHLADHYALGDIFWHPALSDGLPNAVLEAMACGLPVVASAVGGAVDIAGQGPLAPWLLPRPDAPQLAATTARLLAMSEAERRTLGGALRQHVVEYFSPTAEVAAYGALYRSLLGEG